MAKKGTFKPGQSGNPNGRPKLTEEQKAVRKITNESLEDIADLILNHDKPALISLANSLTEPAIRVIYAKAAVNAMTKGDVGTLETILNRLVGPVKAKLQLSNDKDNPLPASTIHISLDDRIKLLKGEK